MEQNDNFSPSNSTSMSNDVRQLSQALLLAKREFKSTGKSGNNSHIKAKYALLEDIYSAIQIGLTNNNIIIWHFRDISSNDEKTEVLYTRLTHTISGQYIEDRACIVSEKPGNQGRGAALTYMKRYAVLSLCGIAAEDDDDGQGEQRYIEQRTYGKQISITQIKELKDEMLSASNPAKLWESIKRTFNIENISELNDIKYKEVKSYIAKEKLNS